MLVAKTKPCKCMNKKLVFRIGRWLIKPARTYSVLN